MAERCSSSTPLSQASVAFVSLAPRRRQRVSCVCCDRRQSSSLVETVAFNVGGAARPRRWLLRLLLQRCNYSTENFITRPLTGAAAYTLPLPSPRASACVVDQSAYDAVLVVSRCVAAIAADDDEPRAAGERSARPMTVS
jgi:hypothetical protein